VHPVGKILATPMGHLWVIVLDDRERHTCVNNLPSVDWLH